ncbi:MBG domain-containing protein [Mucilaginibacter sp.]|uniref:MBG domain-containing protein n=1 Tax=Mucilaginibacter sp. TaxID=1882438 RepID=UPI00262D032F|nr:MBG domain-containing protein [Mucilaginibacter sp.]MDB4921260.1 hypothetical protein [Mucilaginibacter sp.]
MNKIILFLLVFIFIVPGSDAKFIRVNNNHSNGFAKTNQAITFTAMAAQKYGAADLDPAAKASSGLAVTYTSNNTAVATIVSGKIHIIAAGTAIITATQAGNANYNAAAAVMQTLTVNKAALTVIAANQIKTYGAANPVFVIAYVGFVNGNTEASLTKKPTVATTATTASVPGNYPLTPDGAVSANYTFTYLAGKITVNKATLTVVAANQVKSYGAANPAFVMAYVGFVNGNTEASLTTKPTVTTTATTASVPGNYPLTPGGAVSANYTFTYLAGKITINKAALIIKAVNQTKTYTAANPALAVTYTGFVNGNTEATLTAKPTITTTATAASLVGSYPIAVSGAAAANYTIAYVNGTLTVTKPVLTITAVTKTKTYGAANPALTLTYAGFVNGSTDASLTTKPTITTTATTTSPAGSYPITVSGAVAASYIIVYVNSALTVNKAPLTVIAANQVKTYGAANPTFITAYVGFVNGNTEASLATKPKVTTTATTASAVGSYPLIPDGAASANYTFTYLAGKITINPAPLTIAAINQSRVYGAVNPAFTASYTGFVNENTETSLTTKPAFATTATAASIPGSYPITASGAASANYTIKYIAGALTVSKAPLIITAENKTKAYGAANPALTVTYTGFVNDNTTASLTTQPTVSTTATTTSAAGSYPITVSGAVAANYAITYVAGTLNVASGLNAPLISYSNPQLYTSGIKIPALSATNAGGAVPAAAYGQVTTYAGSGTIGAVDGTGTAASFSLPQAVVSDVAGNLYIADAGNNIIRKITPAGIVTTIAGNGTGAIVNGTGTAASFVDPRSIAIDPSGNLYVGEVNYFVIRKITPAGVVTTFAGSGTFGTDNGTGTAASFGYIDGLTCDPEGNIYVADSYHNIIRKITPAAVVTTFAGSGNQGSLNGPGTVAYFHSPRGIASDGSGNIYVDDAFNYLVRKITPAGVVTTLAGSGRNAFIDGKNTSASFSELNGITTDIWGNIYITDSHFIRMITPDGTVVTIAGNQSSGAINGIGSAARFYNPMGLTTNGSGSLYIADSYNRVVRKINLTGYGVSPALPAGLNIDGPTGVISGTTAVVSPATTYVVTAANLGGNSLFNLNIAVNNPVAGAVPAISYNQPEPYVLGLPITMLTPANTGGAVPQAIYGQVSLLAGNSAAGAINGTGPAAKFSNPVATATDKAGNLYVADAYNNLIRKITPAGVVSTFAGSGNASTINGTGTSASFNAPWGLAIDISGNIYVSEYGGNVIRKITPTAVVTTFAGSGAAGSADGTGIAATFKNPYNIAIDVSGNLYVADNGNNKIRKVTPEGIVSTLAGNGMGGADNGTGAAATFLTPRGVVADAAGNVYVGDSGNNLIRKITAAGVVTTFAGSGTAGSANGTGTAASFYNPMGLAIDKAGNIYVADSFGGSIRKITPGGVVTTVASSHIFTVPSYNTASLMTPSSLALDDMGNLYISDSGNNEIEKINITGYGIYPPLPQTLSFDGTTGVISGTPTAIIPTTPFTITGYNTMGSSSVSVSFTVNSSTVAAPSISYGEAQTYTKDNAIAPLSPVNTGGAVPLNTQQAVSTFAGSGVGAYLDGNGTAARFAAGAGKMVFDKAGNMYLADQFNFVIRKITPAGVVSTFAGNRDNNGLGDGTGTNAGFISPNAITIDSSGNFYVSDVRYIRKITPDGVVTTLAGGSNTSYDGTGSAAGFSQIQDLTTDASGNIIVLDYGKIRKITPAGVVTTLLYNSGLILDYGITIDGAGNLYTTGYDDVNKITPDGTFTTIAGQVFGFYGSAINGTGSQARFNFTEGIAIDKGGDLYIADSGNQLIRKVTQAGVVTTYAGTTAGVINSDLAGSRFNNPAGMAFDASGNLYVKDMYNFMIRKIGPTGYSISPALPSGLTINPITGIISGTPTAVHAATNYTITAYNSGGTSITTLNIKVDVAATQGMALSFQVDTLALDATGQPAVKHSMSPNGDGVGDVLMVDGILNYPDNKLVLMSKSGQKVYETSGYNNVNKVFDGHSSINGTMQHAGTYFYILEYKDKGILRHKTGYFLIKY